MTVGLYFKENTNGQLRMDMPGPDKVVYNLIKGLQSMNVDYLINQDGDVNVILQNVSRLYGDLSNCFLGPNIATLPKDVVTLLNYNSYRKIIVPSVWVKNLYSNWIPSEKIEIWSVGIDTEKFNKSASEKVYDFLIYFKRRNSNELNQIIEILNKKNKSFVLIQYGQYNEDYFIESISKSKFGIVIDGTESQGVALQEIMSCDLPLIVWDVEYWMDGGDSCKCSATSVPYFDKRCGLKFYSIEEFDTIYEIFINNKYSPREFILENLSIEKTTEDLIQIIKK